MRFLFYRAFTLLVKCDSNLYSKIKINPIHQFLKILTRIKDISIILQNVLLSTVRQLWCLE